MEAERSKDTSSHLIVNRLMTANPAKQKRGLFLNFIILYHVVISLITKKPIRFKIVNKPMSFKKLDSLHCSQKVNSQVGDFGDDIHEDRDSLEEDLLIQELVVIVQKHRSVVHG